MEIVRVVLSHTGFSGAKLHWLVMAAACKDMWLVRIQEGLDKSLPTVEPTATGECGLKEGCPGCGAAISFSFTVAVGSLFLSCHSC